MVSESSLGFPDTLLAIVLLRTWEEVFTMKIMECGGYDHCDATVKRSPGEKTFQ
jgi:hypothetical protein